MHPYFIRDRTDLLKLLKRGKTPPPCEPYYQSRVYKTCNSVGEHEGCESDCSSFEMSEPEMIKIARIKGQKKRAKRSRCDVNLETYNSPSQKMVKRGKYCGENDGTRGKTEERTILNNGLYWNRVGGGGGGNHGCIRVKEGGGGVEGEAKVVDGVQRAERSPRRAYLKLFPPGRMTTSTNSSGGYSLHYNHSNLHVSAQELEQQTQLGKCISNGGRCAPPLSHSPSYSELLEHFKTIDEISSLSRQRKSDIQPPFGDYEGKSSIPSRRSSPSYARNYDAPCSLRELMEVADSLEAQINCPELLLSAKRPGSECSDTIGSGFTSEGSLSTNYSSSTLFDLSNVADSLSVPRPSCGLQQDTESHKVVSENEHLNMAEEPQFEQQQQQHDASASTKDMSTTHNVAIAEQKPNILNAISRAIFSSFSKMKMQENNQKRQQRALRNANAMGMGDKAGQGYNERQVYPSFSENHLVDSSADVAYSRGGASRITTQSVVPDNRYPEAPLGACQSFSEPMRSSSIGDPQNISDVDMAPSILLKLRSSISPSVP